ncbi:hypothetical protein N7488_008606 [Penicillium malachiteum]|nr:hypothetical protein N7488_008606 [Penicillium malachiteum]
MSSLYELLHRQRPGRWQRFWTQPFIFLAQMFYRWHEPIPAMPITKPIAVVCIFDNHNAQIEVPDGDILIHAGDLTQSGSWKELHAAIIWLGSLPHPTKIVIAGNHKLLLDSAQNYMTSQTASQRAQIGWGGIQYLENEEITIPGYGGSL